MEDKVVSGSTPSPASEQPADSGPEPVSVDLESDAPLEPEPNLAAPRAPAVTAPGVLAERARRPEPLEDPDDVRAEATLRNLSGEDLGPTRASMAAAIAEAVEARRSEPPPPVAAADPTPDAAIGPAVKRSSPPPPPSRRNQQEASPRESVQPPPAPSGRAARDGEAAATDEGSEPHQSVPVEASSPQPHQPLDESGAEPHEPVDDPSPDGPAASPVPTPDSMPPVELRRVIPPKSDGTEMERAPPVRSSLPPALVEPSRIIEVIGSDTPIFSTNWDDEVEDLDETEATEVYESLVPEEEAPTSEVEIDLRDVDSLPPPGANPRPAVPPKKKPRPAATTGNQSSGNQATTNQAAGNPTTANPATGNQKPPPPKARRSKVAAKAWWEEMFSNEFLRAIPILLPRQLATETDFIERSLEVQKGARILDLACGAGQHAVELASRGYEVVGFDASQAQLDWALELATERGQKLQLINGDMRTLTYQEAFDAVCCWNTSFGYFEEEKNIDVAQRIFASLRPGGRLLLDVVNRDFVVAEQPGQTWFEGDGCVCIDDVTIDFITSRLRVKRTMMLTSGKNCECNYSVRLYCLHELGRILHDVGFQVLEVSGRAETPGVFFGETSPRLIILASKPTG